MYENLHKDHVELLAIAGELRDWVGRDTLENPNAFAQCRWRLARLATQHLAVEDAHVYARLAKDSRPEVVAISARFRNDPNPLRIALNAHIAQWTADAVRAEWGAYCIAVRKLLDALEGRIAYEENTLYPLLFGSAKRAA